MPNLNILLGDGFRNDTVIIRINGEEVARRSNVTTDLRISSAGRLDLKTPAAAVSVLTVEVPQQGVIGRLPLTPSETPYVAVSVQDQKLEFHSSATPLPVF